MLNINVCYACKSFIFADAVDIHLSKKGKQYANSTDFNCHAGSLVTGKDED